jgi:hypothetical protein
MRTQSGAQADLTRYPNDFCESHIRGGHLFALEKAMKSAAIRKVKVFLTLLGLFAYLVASFVLLLVSIPALALSANDTLVLLGLSLPFAWLITSICLITHVFNKRRTNAAPIRGPFRESKN